MKILYCIIVLLALIAGAACADIYPVPLGGVGRTYLPSFDVSTTAIDMGTTFSSISGVSVLWSGMAMPTLVWNMDISGNLIGPYQCHPRFKIEIRPVGTGFVFGGEQSDTGVLAGSFGLTTPLVGAWDFLMSGKADVYVTYSEDANPGSYTEYGHADLYGATLVIDGTQGPVPEPSSFLALGSGILGLVGVVRRRSS